MLLECVLASHAEKCVGCENNIFCISCNITVKISTTIYYKGLQTTITKTQKKIREHQSQKELQLRESYKEFQHNLLKNQNIAKSNIQICKQQKKVIYRQRLQLVQNQDNIFQKLKLQSVNIQEEVKIQIQPDVVQEQNIEEFSEQLDMNFKSVIQMMQKDVIQTELEQQTTTTTKANHLTKKMMKLKFKLGLVQKQCKQLQYFYEREFNEQQKELNELKYCLNSFVKKYNMDVKYIGSFLEQLQHSNNNKNQELK